MNAELRSIRAHFEGIRSSYQETSARPARYSRRLTRDKRSSVLQKSSLKEEFGSPGLAYSNGTFGVEAQDLARVKGDLTWDREF